jgi:hypothetical protein
MADESGDYEVQELDPRVFQVPEFLPGQKVQITIGSTTKHAEVRFVGPLTGMKGFWLGVQYEDKASRDPPSLSLSLSQRRPRRRPCSRPIAPLQTFSLRAAFRSSPRYSPPTSAKPTLSQERSPVSLRGASTGWQERRPAQ